MPGETLPLPFQAHSPTSRAAAEAIGPSRQILREKLLAHLRKHGPLTDEQMQRGVPMDPSTQRPRRGELVKLGLVVEAGESRTSKGRRATLWKAA